MTLPVLPPFPTPTPQRSRTCSGCACGGPCAYCGEAIDGWHEHDHFPIPWRHGGRETVPACFRCHSLKDRLTTEYWPPASIEAAVAGTNWAGGLHHKMLCNIINEPEEFSIAATREAARDVALEIVGSCCSTAESRIMMAIGFCLAMDAKPLPKAHGKEKTR
jgi:hypothetical protein